MNTLKQCNLYQLPQENQQESFGANLKDEKSTTYLQSVDLHMKSAVEILMMTPVSNEQLMASKDQIAKNKARALALLSGIASPDINTVYVTRTGKDIVVS